MRNAARLAKGIITATTVYDVLWRRRVRTRVVDRWKATGRPVPPPIEEKHALLLQYGASLSTLVETGTFWGQTVAAMRPHFERVMSVELEPTLARYCRKRFAPFRDVEIIEGDSADVLNSLNFDTPVLFWLDGHDSGGGTAATEPLRDELIAVMRTPPGSVALIDDARTFTGPPRMTLEEIRATVTPRFRMSVEDDVIRLT